MKRKFTWEGLGWWFVILGWFIFIVYLGKILVKELFL